MKHTNKLFKILSIVAITPTIAMPIITFTSCSNDSSNITNIQLRARKTVVHPGDKVQVDVSYEPRDAKEPKIKWELIDIPEILHGVTINDTGLVSVPSSIVIALDEHPSITIKASVVGNEKVSAETKINVTNSEASGFLGFQDDEIEYLDSNKNPAKMKIKKTGNTYETEADIDFFEMEQAKGEGWDAPINFVPLFADDADHNMQFWKDHRLGFECISFFDQYYTEGADTLTIPDFFCYKDDFPLTYLKVTFTADETIEFIIHFHLWQNRTQTTLGRILYKEDSTPHTYDYEILMQGEGEYICNLYCPIKRDDNDNVTFSDTLSTIICEGGLKEFTDYDIYASFEQQSQQIKEAFTLNLKTPEKHVRDFDKLPYWTTCFTYSFDLSKMLPTEQYKYETFYLFQLCLHDKWSQDPKSTAAKCTFSIEWIDE